MIVLDSHVWVWWLDDPGRLPARTQHAVRTAADDRAIYVSTISSWEIVMLASRNRLKFTMDAQDWIAKCEALPFLNFVPVDNAIAMRSVRLPQPFHRDPADRIIVATAMIMGAPLVSSDARILKYGHVKTIWN